jgi:hypothetical protein
MWENEVRATPFCEAICHCGRKAAPQGDWTLDEINEKVGRWLEKNQRMSSPRILFYCQGCKSLFGTKQFIYGQRFDGYVFSF